MTKKVKRQKLFPATDAAADNPQSTTADAADHIEHAAGEPSSSTSVFRHRRESGELENSTDIALAPIRTGTDLDNLEHSIGLHNRSLEQQSPLTQRRTPAAIHSRTVPSSGNDISIDDRIPSSRGSLYNRDFYQCRGFVYLIILMVIYVISVVIVVLISSANSSLYTSFDPMTLVSTLPLLGWAVCFVLFGLVEELGEATGDIVETHTTNLLGRKHRGSFIHRWTSLLLPPASMLAVVGLMIYFELGFGVPSLGPSSGLAQY